MAGRAGPSLTCQSGLTGRNKVEHCFLSLALISYLLSIHCVALSYSAAWQDVRLKPDPQNQIWLQDDANQPTYKLLDQPDRSYPLAEPALEAELATLEALQTNSLDKSRLSYENDNSLEPRLVVENNLLPERIDPSDVSLGRLITRPTLSASSIRFQQPIEYPHLSNQPRYTVEESNENEIDKIKLVELLNTEKAFVNSLALLDLDDRVSFDEDNATYSDVKTPSFTSLPELVGPSKTVDQPSASEGEQPVRVNIRRVGSGSESTVVSSTLLDDDDLDQSSNAKADSRQPDTSKTAQKSVDPPERSSNVLSELTSVLSLLYNKTASFLPSFSASVASIKPKSSQTPAKPEVSELSGPDNKRTHDKLDDSGRDYTSNDKHSDPHDKQRYENARRLPLSSKSHSETSTVDDVEDLIADSSELLHRFATHRTRPPASTSNDASSVSSSSAGSTLDHSDSEGAQKVDGITKYIYAPEHHIHLDSNRLSKKTSTSGDFLMDDDDDVEDFENFDPFQAKKIASLHRGHTRHFKPGDPVYGSYISSPGPHVLDHESPLAQNKSNDLYFLVMVAAFCVMAMAVVLAAGLFAYRIQQNRATSADIDYPTYGVVGPNNMSAKCVGATSLVGSYFGSSHAQAQASSMGSSGSVKSAKLTINDSASAGATSDNGILSSSTGSPGGVKSMLGKRAVSMADQMVANQNNAGNKTTGNYQANQNAARMYHYQHQKQQMIIADHNSASGRHTSASDLDSEDENDDGSYTVYECPGLASAHEMEIKNPLFNDDRTP